MKRPSFDVYLIGLAFETACRATCPKRQVGAVIADEDNVIIATGYNGTPRGIPHCIDNPCTGILLQAPQSHHHCNAAHAEINALLMAGRSAKGGTLAITTSPCKECTKAIINAQIKLVIFSERNRLFDDKEAYGTTPKELLEQAGIEYVCIENPY